VFGTATRGMRLPKLAELRDHVAGIYVVGELGWHGPHFRTSVEQGRRAAEAIVKKGRRASQAIHRAIVVGQVRRNRDRVALMAARLDLACRARKFRGQSRTYPGPRS